jgi:hypothetical protein
MSSPLAPKFVSDPVPPFARAVLELYAEALPSVRFPDMDLSVLESAADDLRAAQVELEQIEAELAQARATLLSQAEQLNARCQRALAYARVFAETDPALNARVAALGETGSSAAQTAPKRRGRPAGSDKQRRSEDDDTSLFAAHGTPALEASC